MPYNIVLVSVVQQHESAVSIHSLPLESRSQHTHPPFEAITERRAELPAPHSEVPPAVCLTHGSVYTLVLLSQFAAPSPFPWGPQVHSLHLLQHYLHGSNLNVHRWMNG